MENWKPKKIKDAQYLKWIHEKSCVICGKPEVHAHHLWSATGKRRSNDYTVLPLCWVHHQRFHLHPIEEKEMRDKLNAIATKLYREYKGEKNAKSKRGGKKVTPKMDG